MDDRIGGLTVKRFCSAPGGPFFFLFTLRLLSLYLLSTDLLLINIVLDVTLSLCNLTGHVCILAKNM